jgi:ZIP family zinc transporter
MSTIGAIILVTTVAGVGGTGLGGLVGAMIKRDSQKMVSLLLSFAAGVMLAVVCFDLLQSAIMPDGAAEPTNIYTVLLSVFIGYGVVYLLNYIIDRDTDDEVPHIKAKNHPQTADDLGELIHSKHYEEHKEKRSGLFAAGVVMACAIALHNVPEGIVIGASYAKDSSVILGGSGFVMALIIGLHNIPEGMAVSVPLISGGDSRLHAVLITALSGAPTIIGAIIGYYVGLISPLMLSLSLGFASGAMLYVVFGELMPEAILMWRSKMPALATMIGIAVGMLVIYA